MFVGYQLYYDVEDTLLPLSQGRRVVLEINMLTGQCRAEGEMLPLHISGVMQGWLAEQLRRQKIPAEAIPSATLRVKYQAQQVKYTNPQTWWDRLKEKLGRPGGYFLESETEFSCRASIQTSDYEYLSQDGRTVSGSPRRLKE